MNKCPFSVRQAICMCRWNHRRKNRSVSHVPRWTPSPRTWPSSTKRAKSSPSTALGAGSPKPISPCWSACLEGANYLELFRSADGCRAEESAAIVAGIQAVMQNQRQEFVFESHCHSPEDKRWFNVRVTRFSGDGPVHIVVAHEDVTERKRAEESLRAARRGIERCSKPRAMR